MKRIVPILALSLATTSCTTYLSNLWDGIITGVRQTSYTSKTLAGKDADSRLVATTEEFFGSLDADFIPLSDQDISAQAKEIPGLPGGKLPGIDAFSPPSKALAATFCKIYFNTDQHIPKDKEHIKALHKMAAFLKKHPNVCVFIEGHTDQRASEAYNLSLGTRRSNCVRSLLIKDGVNPEQLFTISYGKERPEIRGNGEKFWCKNRRVLFKLYDKEGKL